MIVTDISNTAPDQLKGMATMVVANVLTKQKTSSQTLKFSELSCCNPNYVFADLTNSDDYYNDRSSFIYKRLISSDTIAMVLEKNISGTWTQIDTLDDNTLGTYYNFGSLANADLKGYLLLWASVLQLHGVGNYRVKIDRTILGVSDTLYSIVFTLAVFDVHLADRTVRLEWYQDGRIYDGIDYTGCNWYQQIRTPGFFGDEQYKKNEVLWKDAAYKQHQVRSDISYHYTLLIGWIPQCFRDIFLYNFFQGYQIYLTDYNIDNFEWSIDSKTLLIESIEETEYQHRERIAKYTVKFTDVITNRIKKNF